MLNTRVACPGLTRMVASATCGSGSVRSRSSPTPSASRWSAILPSPPRIEGSRWSATPRLPTARPSDGDRRHRNVERQPAFQSAGTAEAMGFAQVHHRQPAFIESRSVIRAAASTGSGGASPDSARSPSARLSPWNGAVRSTMPNGWHNSRSNEPRRWTTCTRWSPAITTVAGAGATVVAAGTPTSTCGQWLEDSPTSTGRSIRTMKSAIGAGRLTSGRSAVSPRGGRANRLAPEAWMQGCRTVLSGQCRLFPRGLEAGRRGPATAGRRQWGVSCRFEH